MDYNIILETIAKKHPNRVAKIFADKDFKFTYSDISRFSFNVACWLKEQGLKRGDTFAIWMGNVPEFIIMMAASLRIGTILVPISIYESIESVNEICQECNCSYLFFDSKNKYIKKQTANKKIPSGIKCLDLNSYGEKSDIRLDFINKIYSDKKIRCELDVNDDIIITYSSGSTGKKKGIRKCIRSYFGKKGFPPLYRFLLNSVNLFYPVQLFNLCPWYHNTGTTLQMVTLSGGHFIEIITERYNPYKVFKFIKKLKPNLWLGTATMLYRCCLSENDMAVKLPSFIFSTGEAIPYHIIDKLEKYQGTSVLYSGYGTTESGNISQIWYRFRKLSIGMKLLLFGIKKSGLTEKIYSINDFREDIKGEVLGVINKSVEILIFDNENNQALKDGEAGEICVRSSMKMNGYLDEADNDIYVIYNGKKYLRTGDIGYKQDNMLYLSGRKKNMIIRSGENIIPSEIESIALSCNGVSEAIACGIPSTTYGEDICLCLETEKEKFDLNDLQLKLKNKLPKYMYPQHFLLWDEFPINTTGKTDVLRIKEDSIKKVENYNIS